MSKELEALNNIAIISEILVEVSKSHIMPNKAINEIRKLGIGEIYFTLRQALERAKKEHELLNAYRQSYVPNENDLDKLIKLKEKELGEIK